MRRLVIAGLLTLSCEARRVTQIVIRVQATDPGTLALIERVDLRVTRRGGATILDAVMPPAGQRLPGEVGVIPRDPSDPRPLDVEARARLRGGAQLLEHVEVTFTEDHRTLLVLDFHRACETLACGPSETCAPEGETSLVRCQPRARTLREYVANDAGSSAVDARRDTITDDAPTDATDVFDAAPDATERIDASRDVADEARALDVADSTDSTDSTDITDSADITDITDVASDAGAPQGPLLACGARHCCRVTRSERVECWGAGAEGQLGIGTRASSSLPIEVQTLRNVVQVAAGAGHTCALERGGQLWCWGRADLGQLGRGDTIESLTPVAARITEVVDVSTRDEHVCVVRRDGGVWCWGASRGVVFTSGAPPERAVQIPVTVVRAATRVWAGWASSCALHADGVTCWGDGSVPLGDGSTSRAPRAVPFRIPAGAGAVTSMSLSRDGGCARLALGRVACWGGNALGQVGDGSTAPRLMPDFSGDATDVVEVVTGDAYACALYDASTISCWGTDHRGELCQGTAGVVRLTASPVARLGLVAGLASGAETVCARRGDGTTHCWGRNDEGQAGDSARSDRATFTTMPP